MDHMKDLKIILHLQVPLIKKHVIGEVPIEAELGKVGGKEDDLDGGREIHIQIHGSGEFVERTGIDSLA